MTPSLLVDIRDYLYLYCCGRVTARGVQRQLRRLGYKADLRSSPNSNVILVQNLQTGELHEVEV